MLSSLLVEVLRLLSMILVPKFQDKEGQAKLLIKSSNKLNLRVESLLLTMTQLSLEIKS